MIDSPSGGAPEKAPGWDLTGIEGCGGGNRVLWCSRMFSGYISIYSRRKEVGGATRVGVHLPPGRALHPRGPLVAPPTYFFLLYIPTYPQTISRGAKTLFPPPQPSVPVRSHLGAFSSILPEGDSITEGFYTSTPLPF